VSTARSDAGLVVTEFGVADLRGQPLRERAVRLVAIAPPDRRAALEEQAAGG
jgi:acetyl-CoA hydrolase